MMFRWFNGKDPQMLAVMLLVILNTANIIHVMEVNPYHEGSRSLKSMSEPVITLIVLLAHSWYLPLYLITPDS